MLWQKHEFGRVSDDVVVCTVHQKHDQIRRMFIQRRQQEKSSHNRSSMRPCQWYTGYRFHTDFKSRRFSGTTVLTDWRRELGLIRLQVERAPESFSMGTANCELRTPLFSTCSGWSETPSDPELRMNERRIVDGQIFWTLSRCVPLLWTTNMIHSILLGGLPAWRTRACGTQLITF